MGWALPQHRPQWAGPSQSTAHNGLDPLKAPPTMGWTLPHQSLIRKMPPQTCLQANHTESFSQYKLPLPNESSLCRVDIKLTGTASKLSFSNLNVPVRHDTLVRVQRGSEQWHLYQRLGGEDDTGS